MVNKYTWIRVPDHPFVNGSGYMRKHRFVWEQHNNAVLLPWGNVHHKNGKKCDNRIENLEVMMIGEHTIRHNPRLGTGKKNYEIFCQCGCGEKLLKYYIMANGQLGPERQFINHHGQRKIEVMGT